MAIIYLLTSGIDQSLLTLFSMKTLLQYLLMAVTFVACTSEGSVKQMPIPTVELSPEVETIVAALAAAGRVESAPSGDGGEPSGQWKQYEQLRTVATEDELVVLTNHPKEVVRCYAFQALVTTRSDKVFPILLDHCRLNFY